MDVYGEYHHSIDAKKRLFIPAKFREDLGEEFYITRKFDAYLSVYTAEDWENYARQIIWYGRRNKKTIRKIEKI